MHLIYIQLWGYLNIHNYYSGTFSLQILQAFCDFLEPVEGTSDMIMSNSDVQTWRGCVVSSLAWNYITAFPEWWQLKLLGADMADTTKVLSVFPTWFLKHTMALYDGLSLTMNKFLRFCQQQYQCTVYSCWMLVLNEVKTAKQALD